MHCPPHCFRHLRRTTFTATLLLCVAGTLSAGQTPSGLIIPRAGSTVESAVRELRAGEAPKVCRALLMPPSYLQAAANRFLSRATLALGPLTALEAPAETTTALLMRLTRGELAVTVQEKQARGFALETRDGHPTVLNLSLEAAEALLASHDLELGSFIEHQAKPLDPKLLGAWVEELANLDDQLSPQRSAWDSLELRQRWRHGLSRQAPDTFKVDELAIARELWPRVEKSYAADDAAALAGLLGPATGAAAPDAMMFRVYLASGDYRPAFAALGQRAQALAEARAELAAGRLKAAHAETLLPQLQGAVAEAYGLVARALGRSTLIVPKP